MSMSKSILSLYGTHHNEFSAGVARRVSDAHIEEVPLEELVRNLRSAFVGNYERITEARFEEVVDIISDQKGSTDDRFTSLLNSVNYLKEQQLEFDQSVGALNERFTELSGRISAEIKSVLQYCHDVALETRQEAQLMTKTAVGDLDDSLHDLSTKTRESLATLSNSLATHTTEDENKWEERKAYTHSILEQRIRQWRAEIEDERVGDMNHIANSMVEFGQRLMSVNKH
jgi:dsDNA-specific endonuclease/ATPase MutS2